MRIEPAHIDQLHRALDGRMIPISSDAGGVADDLRRIDPGLKVRFAENGRPPFWAVYYEDEDGRSTHLVLTAKAYQSASGVWTGLDQRIVRRVMELGHESYDYAAEVERQNRRAAKAKRQRFEETVAETGDVLAHALRKDLGAKYKGRVFVP